MFLQLAQIRCITFSQIDYSYITFHVISVLAGKTADILIHFVRQGNKNFRGTRETLSRLFDNMLN